jgi:hypothetical protein
MDDITAEQPAPRERIGSRAWVRTSAWSAAAFSRAASSPAR